MLIQFIFIAAFIVALLITWKRAKQNVISRIEALAWSVAWIAACVVVLLPQTTTIVAHFVGVGRGADLIIYGSIIVLFFLVFKIFVAIDRLEHDLTKIVRTDALKDLQDRHD